MMPVGDDPVFGDSVEDGGPACLLRSVGRRGAWRKIARWGALALFAAAAVSRAQVGTSKHLYTPPDPAARGGIRGHASGGGEGPLAAVFAIPSAEPLLVYKGEVTGADKRGFLFEHLPVARYDLMLVFDGHVYEGLTLIRGESTLTDDDRAKITDIIQRSEPYFNEKTVHRLEGTTGRMEGTARAVCTFLRSKTSTGFMDGKAYTDHRRSIKLALLEEVGPGWQVARTREIYVIMTKPGTGRIEHAYTKALGGIRVVDAVKDLGDITLK